MGGRGVGTEPEDGGFAVADPCAMNWIALLKFAPLLALLTWAAVGDARTRRITNAFSLALALAGLLQSCTAGRTVSPGASALGLLAGFGLLFIPFALGALGGGDVKLLAAVGTWVGPWGIIAVYALTSLAAMAIALSQAAAQGRLRLLFRNSAVVAVNLLHFRELGADHAATVGRSCRSIDRPLPYAVPVLCGLLMLLGVPGLSRFVG